MKKAIFIIAFMSGIANGYSQWNQSGPSIISNIFRTGSVGIGYTALPAFSPFKFKVNGKSLFEAGTLVVGSNFSTFEENQNPANPFVWGLKSSKSIIVEDINDPISSTITLRSSGLMLQMAMAKCNGCYSQNALVGDAILRANANNLIITNEYGGSLKFASNSSYFASDSKVHMIIKPGTGNVGIGTETPDEKLSVNGVVHAKEVKVDLVGWPDYVFEKDYVLPTLREVEQHIKENGHLINVPSAVEIETNGLLVSDISKKQQEKIEELTLYVIEQNKINEQQAKEIEELKKLVNQLLAK